MDPADAAHYALNVVNPSSQLVQLVRKSGANNMALPDATTTAQVTAITPSVIGKADDSSVFKALAQSRDGGVPDRAALTAGVSALDAIAPFVFNILCLPRAALLGDADLKGAYEDAIAYCRSKRAIVLIDPPAGLMSPKAITDWRNDATKMPKPDANAVLYWPRLNVADPLQGGLTKSVGSSGAVAGDHTRRPTRRGASGRRRPARTRIAERGRSQRSSPTRENGVLNPLGVNALRTFPIYGNVVWGARTLVGADQRRERVEVRAGAAALRSSSRRASTAGRKWVVFEPNDEPLWAQIRLNVGAFMHDLFRQGAFQGATPRDAYLVKCDTDTTTQDDIDRGIVNILVGFAPLKPAEFVVIKIQQLAGQIETVRRSPMAQFTVNAAAVRPVQELQVPGEVGRPLRRRRQQGERAQADDRGRQAPRGRRPEHAAGSRRAAPSTRRSRSSAA